ncbi:MAG TPA: hypothetical protein VKS82_05950 [Streptosporangiaceae bacterium]|jgi:hypothetical protein|nr:hypothetical protein [Streptosporangiaceae bacterium]
MLATAASLAIVAAACGSQPPAPAPSSIPATSVRPSVKPSPAFNSAARSGVSGGALFGGNAPMAQEESQLGRKLAIVRVYYQIGQSFPGPSSAQLLAEGSTLLVSLDSSTSGPSYSSIAAGDDDTAILGFLRAVNQAAVQYHLPAIYLCFEHEPENYLHVKLGSAAQFIQAWDHVHQLAMAAHLDWNDGGRLHWVWIMVHNAYQIGGGARTWWPGAHEVDIVAADGYNSYACRLAKNSPQASQGQATPASIFNPVVRFAHKHGQLPVFISEWGSDFDPVGTQSGFIRQMESFVAANPLVDAVLYWDSTGVGCDYSFNSESASISAMNTLAHSSRLQGHLTG